MPPRNYDYSSVCKWIRGFGWEGEIPKSFKDAKQLLHELELRCPPTTKQIITLRAYGCYDSPSTASEASDLITRYKKQPAKEVDSDNFPATDRQIEFLQEIDMVLEITTDYQWLTKGEAFNMIKSRLPVFDEQKDAWHAARSAERKALRDAEREAAKVGKEKEKHETKCEKHRAIIDKQIQGFLSQNENSIKKYANDPIEAVIIVNPSGCPHANRPHEMILLNDAASNPDCLPPYQNCFTATCGLKCRLSAVRRSGL